MSDSPATQTPPARRIKVFFPIYGLDGGGAEKVVINLANHLDRSTFEPVLILLYMGGQYRSHLRPDVRVIELYQRVSREPREPAGPLKIRELGWKRYLKEALRRRLPPEWIESYKRLRHGPWVEDLHQSKSRFRESLRNYIQRLRQKRLITYYIEDFGVWGYIRQSTRDLLPELEAVLDQEGPGVILSNLLLANYLSIRVREKRPWFTAVCIHNTLDDYQVRVEYRKSPLNQADAIVTVSREVGRIFSRKFGPEKIRVINNPHDIHGIRRLAEEEVRHPWFAPKDVPVVVGIGRLRRQKNFELLLAACREITRGRGPGLRLVILGEGPERNLLLKKIRRSGQQGNVSLPGWVPNPYPYLARADLFVLSSDWEGLPNTLIEAMACGVPVISTDCESGIREILQDGTCGPIVRRGDRKGLVKAMLGLLENQEQAALFRRRCRNRAMDFDISRQLPRYEKLILEGMERNCATCGSLPLPPGRSGISN